MSSEINLLPTAERLLARLQRPGLPANFEGWGRSSKFESPHSTTTHTLTFTEGKVEIAERVRHSYSGGQQATKHFVFSVWREGFPLGQIQSQETGSVEGRLWALTEELYPQLAATWIKAIAMP